MRLMSEPGILLLLLSCKLLTPTSGNLQVLRALPSRLSASRSTPRCRSRTPGPPLPSPLRDSPHSLPRSPPIASPGRSLPLSPTSLPPFLQTPLASASPSLPRLPACTSLARPDNSRLSARMPPQPSLPQASLSPSPPSGPHRSQPPPLSPLPFSSGSSPAGSHASPTLHNSPLPAHSSPRSPLPFGAPALRSSRARNPSPRTHARSHSTPRRSASTSDRISVSSNFAAPVSSPIPVTFSPFTSNSSRPVFCSVIMTWNNGLRLRSRPGLISSTSFSNGAS